MRFTISGAGCVAAGFVASAALVAAAGLTVHVHEYRVVTACESRNPTPNRGVGSLHDRRRGARGRGSADQPTELRKSHRDPKLKTLRPHTLVGLTAM